MQRGSFLSAAVAAATTFTLSAPAAARQGAMERIRALESGSGGRLGVFALDTQNGRTVSYRSRERFPMCSTFKFLAVAAVLTRVDAARERLDRQVTFGAGDLLPYAPVTGKHVKDGFMTISALCEAAIVYSDNTAANLLLRAIGGPPGLTHYARALGDSVTTLDRTEPALNTAAPGDVRDTTTPAAMANDMHRILLAGGLSTASRRSLEQWLVACQTGLDCIRAGVPGSWRVGDKTGSGGARNAHGVGGTHNDIAILWPPKRSPIIVAAYLTRSNVSALASAAALAGVGRITTTAFA